MIEVFGDSSRAGEWAAARLLLDGDRIVEADAPGLERDVAGLTLLEAASVGGETLAVDALANALGPVFRATPESGRVAVAMSGGVDSAVALLRSLPNAVGVTLRLPLGEQDKEATRAEAERAGLAAARRPESQEACFLAGDDYREFLGRQGLERRDGAVVGEDGSELGRHDGFWRFTPGQRRGLGLAATEPLYVLGTSPATNAVVVGPRTSLARTRVTARGRLYAEIDRVEAK